jgi:hypothetical protein
MVANSFCSHACAVDADCPVGAVCVYDDGKPYFCAPKGCDGQFKGVLFRNGPAAPPVGPSCG